MFFLLADSVGKKQEARVTRKESKVMKYPQEANANRHTPQQVQEMTCYRNRSGMYQEGAAKLGRLVGEVRSKMDGKPLVLKLDPRLKSDREIRSLVADSHCRRGAGLELNISVGFENHGADILVIAMNSEILERGMRKAKGMVSVRTPTEVAVGA